MTALDVLAHDLAVKAALETLGHPVGYADAPPGALDAVRARTGADYVVVWPLPGGTRSGPAADAFADADLLYQVTIVARLPDGARDLVRRAEDALAALAVEGRSVMQVVPYEPGDVRRGDEAGDPPVFYAHPRYRIRTTPA